MARRTLFVIFDEVQHLDVAGPLEVFSAANRLAAASGGEESYLTEVVAPSGGVVCTSSGLGLASDRALAAVRGPIDTLLVAGGPGVAAAGRDEATIAALGRLAARSRRVASVCTGAFLLAQAGLLDGRRATTHWASCGRLAERHPAVEVDPRPIYVRDGNVWTSAGVTAGLDLALALVADDLGPAVAGEIARWLVVFVRRPGGQAQFSAQLAAQVPGREPLRELLGWLPDHLADDLSVAALARRVAMSERHFSRMFLAEVGVTPGDHVEALRLEAARRLLETTRRPSAEVASACGYRSVETLHRAFRRTLGVTPGHYRSHFAAGA